MRDSREIEHVMRMYGDAVWRACILYLSASDAEDVFQDVFIKYTLHKGMFRDDEHVKAWLLRVAINECKDALKSSRRKNTSLEERVEQCGDEGFSADYGIDEGHEQGVREILDVMDSLDDPPKTQLYLSLCEGYTAREISKICNMPEGTVYSWISRGKAKLKEALS